MVAATDSRHYVGITDKIFRFSPVRANADDLKRFHGTNERLSVEGYADMIRFYRRLIENCGGVIGSSIIVVTGASFPLSSCETEMRRGASIHARNCCSSVAMILASAAFVAVGIDACRGLRARFKKRGAASTDHERRQMRQGQWWRVERRRNGWYTRDLLNYKKCMSGQ